MNTARNWGSVLLFLAAALIAAGDWRMMILFFGEFLACQFLLRYTRVWRRRGR